MAKPAKKTKKKDRKVGMNGVAHVHATFNNTIISITDLDGAVVSWASAGKVGFKGSRKSTPFAAQVAAENAAKEALSAGMRKVRGLGEGAGRRPRSLDPFARGGGTGDHGHPGRHADPAQRVPAAQAAAGLASGSRGDGGPE